MELFEKLTLPFAVSNQSWIATLFIPRCKSNRPFVAFRWLHHFPDRIEYYFELGIVFIFHCIKLPGQFVVRNQ